MQVQGEKKRARDRGGGWGREGEKKRKAGLGNYWTRLGSWGNLSGTHSPRWWGCGRQDHMEGGLWLCSLKLVTRLLPSPWAECEMRLARPNVLHMHHLCHKTNLITVNYVAAIIRRGSATHTHKHRHTYTITCIRKHMITLSHSVEGQHLWKWLDRIQKSGQDGAWPPTRPGALCIQGDDSSKSVSLSVCAYMYEHVLTGSAIKSDFIEGQRTVSRV